MERKRAFVLVRSLRETKTRKFGKLIKGLEERSLSAEILFLEEPSDIERAAKRMGDADFLIAFGGDGTLNVALRLLWASQSLCPLLSIASGTLNDMRKRWKGTSRVGKALQLLDIGNVIEMPIGLARSEKAERPFGYMLAAGDVAFSPLRASRKAKRTLGPLAYFPKALKAIASNGKTPISGNWEGNASFLLFLLGKRVASFPVLAKNDSLKLFIGDSSCFASVIKVAFGRGFTGILPGERLFFESESGWMADGEPIEEKALEIGVSPLPLRVFSGLKSGSK